MLQRPVHDLGREGRPVGGEGPLQEVRDRHPTFAAPRRAPSRRATLRPRPSRSRAAGSRPSSVRRSTTRSATHPGGRLRPPDARAGFRGHPGDEREEDAARIAAGSRRPPATEWYVAIGQAQVGPLPLAEVKRKWEGGEVGPDSLVWRPGMGDWSPLSTVADLAGYLSPVPQGTRAPRVPTRVLDAAPAAGEPAPAPAGGRLVEAGRRVRARRARERGDRARTARPPRRPAAGRPRAAA